MYASPLFGIFSARGIEKFSPPSTDKNIEIISGLNEGDIVVSEGLKKVRPQGKIKPIYK